MNRREIDEERIFLLELIGPKSGSKLPHAQAVENHRTLQQLDWLDCTGSS
jgi:hypothetical protein